MTFVQRQNLLNAIAVGEHDKGCVSKSDSQVCITRNHFSSSVNVLSIEWSQAVGLSRYFIEKLELDIHVCKFCDEVIQLAQDKG